MEKVILIIFSVAVVVGGVVWMAGPEADAAPANDGKELWTCPMHPQIIQDHPGQCPICGMDLVPLKHNSEEAPAETTAPAAGGAKPGVTIDPVVEQNMGVRTAPVERGELLRTVRTIGEIEVAEDAISVVNLRFSGWVERIYVDQTGDAVRRGQPLFSIYSPKLVEAQEEYLQARAAEGPDGAWANSARTRLDLLVGGSWLSQRLDQTGAVERSVTIPSPGSGFVLAKNVVEGSNVMAGKDLYRIGNLTKIWVTAEIYEFDAPWIAKGAGARMELTFQRGKKYEGRVQYVYPTLDRQSRTLRARLEFENPGINLKPGMFATVWIDAERKEGVLRIPTESIINSGERQVVFVALGHGRFEPRDIVTGLQGDDHATEVLTGLAEGDVVVTSGQFLLDSESQLEEAVEKMMSVRGAGAGADAGEKQQ